jgi:lambda family phage portal protein
VSVPQARYDAAGAGRRLRGWAAPSSGPNRAIEGLETLRNRARDAQRNDWAATAGARLWTSNLIGTGIVPRPKTAIAALKARLRALWDSWVPSADADGVLDFYGLQTLAVRSWVVAGEVFVRFRPRRLGDGMDVPLQVQVLEAEMVPLLDADGYPGLPAGHKIRSGVEFDRIGRRVAYWMYRQHPGDRPREFYANDLARVPAEFVRHVYEPIRPGQLRGVSDYAPVLARLRGVMDYDDAVLERQKLANLFTLFITRPNFQPEQLVGAGNASLTAQEMIDLYNAPMNAGLEPGTAHDLLPGEDVKFSTPPDAGSTYGDFMRYQHLGVAAGQGAPYELMSGDIRDVSDRTLRVVINEFRRHCEQRQWQIIIPMLCQPVRDAWADAARLSGALTQTEYAEAKRVHWRPQAWPYIHPVQDRQGKKLDIEMGLRSRGSIIGENGDDPDEVDAERAEDRRRETAMNLVDEPSGEQEARQNVTQALGHIHSRLDSVHTAMAAQPAPSQAQPIHVSVHGAPVNVAQPAVTVENHVAPTPITVEAVMPDQPAPNVTVENHVSAPAVTVENTVAMPDEMRMTVTSMPTRETTTEIKRDSAGNIVESTQIETDQT